MVAVLAPPLVPRRSILIEVEGFATFVGLKWVKNVSSAFFLSR
jgi:hypothetical protein